MSVDASQVTEAITLAAKLIIESHNNVALTGAGSSTGSGIPDFRTPGKGLWTRAEPMRVASLSAFRHDPEKFYAGFHTLATQIFSATPNLAHIALADLQRERHLDTIITQNIDGLQTRAGSVNVLEVHGTLESLSCTNCFLKIPSASLYERYIETCEIPHCPQCGSVMKPDIILYEEQLPAKTWIKAQEACRRCDLMLVAGTSLEVMPVAKLPVEAMDHGAHLIIVNNAETYMDIRADVVIHADVTEILPLIRDQVTEQLNPTR